MFKLKKSIYIIFYLFTIVFLVFPTHYQVLLPGDTTSFDEQVMIENHEIPTISSIYVISYEPITLFQYTLIQFFQNGQLFIPNESTQEMTLKEKHDAAQLQKLSSYMISAIVAYTKAEKAISYEFEGYAVTSLLNQDRTIKIGDYITSINGIPLEIDTDFSQFNEMLTLDFEVNRNQEKLNIIHERSISDLPLSLYPIFTITQSNPVITFPGLDSVVGGPSGGMMMTLTIYLSLMHQSYDLNIVGTGTIQIDGTIGIIGGLNEKYETVKDDMDIMFIPLEQFDTLSNNNDARIVPINHLDDAILYLSVYHG
jgi:PDZ domain-containing protein